MSRPEKLKRTFVKQQEKTQRWRYGYSQSFSESNKFSYQETSAVTSGFNHPREDYVNYIFIYF